ncbi:helix-hairpin-helix domain-containing protein [Bowmanella pacifica]|uniref:Competence protein ComEA n=1 Tax=Bowmanella pacifica TaxID=502051 RepID=A0A918DKK6_9ALTE|nr:helix-hairpin-helix domain-containing protein [Bowmanella pacifica]GGO72021.1 competence protein ComEA [Bowmanella pacifica]
MKKLSVLLAVMLGLSAPVLASDKDVNKERGQQAEAAVAGININTASAKELMKLPGIGKSKAEAIVKYRQDNGDFQSIEDLAKIQGIGKQTVKALAGKANVR